MRQGLQRGSREGRRVRGRRPSPLGARPSIDINGQSKEVQDEIDETSLLLLKEIKKQIADRLVKGGFNNTELTALTKELHGLLGI